MIHDDECHTIMLGVSIRTRGTRKDGSEFRSIVASTKIKNTSNMFVDHSREDNGDETEWDQMNLQTLTKPAI